MFLALYPQDLSFLLWNLQTWCLRSSSGWVTSTAASTPSSTPALVKNSSAPSLACFAASAVDVAAAYAASTTSAGVRPSGARPETRGVTIGPGSPSMTPAAAPSSHVGAKPAPWTWKAGACSLLCRNLLSIWRRRWTICQTRSRAVQGRVQCLRWTGLRSIPWPWGSTASAASRAAIRYTIWQNVTAWKRQISKRRRSPFERKRASGQKHTLLRDTIQDRDKEIKVTVLFGVVYCHEGNLHV